MNYNLARSLKMSLFSSFNFLLFLSVSWKLLSYSAIINAAHSRKIIRLNRGIVCCNELCFVCGNYRIQHFIEFVISIVGWRVKQNIILLRRFSTMSLPTFALSYHKYSQEKKEFLISDEELLFFVFNAFRKDAPQLFFSMQVA